MATRRVVNKNVVFPLVTLACHMCGESYEVSHLHDVQVADEPDLSRHGSSVRRAFVKCTYHNCIGRAYFSDVINSQLVREVDAYWERLKNGKATMEDWPSPILTCSRHGNFEAWLSRLKKSLSAGYGIGDIGYSDNAYFRCPYMGCVSLVEVGDEFDNLLGYFAHLL